MEETNSSLLFYYIILIGVYVLLQAPNFVQQDVLQE